MNRIPPPPKPEPRKKMAIGDPVIGISRMSDFRVEGTFDGTFKADVNGQERTLFWVKDAAGDRYRFFPREVRTRQP